MTPLDTAHAAMDAAPKDDAARLRFFERLLDGEIFLLLEAEPLDNDIKPRLFDTGEGRFVLAFDLEERLTAFTGGSAPYAALPGRALAALLSDQNIGLGLNLDVAPSSILIPPAAVTWLCKMLENDPQELTATAIEFSAPKGLPERLIAGIDTKLATAGGLAKTAYLSRVTYSNNRRGHLITLIDALPDAEPALARAISEALVFSGMDAGEIDVAFLSSTDSATANLAKVGLRFDLPQPEKSDPQPPGMNPSRPPTLR